MQIKDAEDLDKLYKQMRANSEANKLMETSFDDALARQYEPLIKVIGKQTEAIGEQTKGLLAIEGPKPLKAISGGEDFENGKMNNLPRDILEDYMTRPDSERDTANGIKTASDGSFMFNNTAVNLDEDGKSVSISEKKYKVTRGLMEMLTLKSPKNYSPEDVDTYIKIYNKYGNPGSLTGKSHRRKLLDKVATVGFKVAESLKKFEEAEKEAKSVKEEQPISLSLPKPLVQSTKHDGFEDPNEPTVSDEDKLKKMFRDYGTKPFKKGSGLLPSNPLSLHKMLNLRLAAYQAGKTGLRNEVIAISDELLRQKAIKKVDYKKIVGIVENVKPKKK